MFQSTILESRSFIQKIFYILKTFYISKSEHAHMFLLYILQNYINWAFTLYFLVTVRNFEFFIKLQIIWVLN